MKFNNKKVAQMFYDEIVSTKERINVIPGKCRYNYKCQMNAAHEALENNHEKLAMVVYFADKKVNPIIHFINYHEDKYIDNTLGQWTSDHEYYLIRHISKDDFRNVDYIFGAYRREIRNKLSWWHRITSNVEF